MRSVFDALKLVLRHKNDPRSSFFNPRARAPPPPIANTHIYVQEKYDGHRQHVSIAADGSVSVHGKETAELETVADSFLETLRAELAQLPRPCLLDGEILAWDATGHVSLDLVKPARGGTHRRWAVVLFDITCSQVETADYESRHALLEAVLGSTPGPLNDAQRLSLNRHVLVASTLATWTTATTPQACADVGRLAIEAGLEGLVLHPTQWALGFPGEMPATFAAPAAAHRLLPHRGGRGARGAPSACACCALHGAARCRGCESGRGASRCGKSACDVA